MSERLNSNRSTFHSTKIQRARRLAVLGLIFVPTMIIVSSCAEPEVEYAKAKQAGTIEAHEKFLKRFSQTELAEEAAGSLRDLRYKDVCARNTIPALQEFLDTYPDHKLSQDIYKRLADLEFEEAMTAGSVEALRFYVEKYSSHANARKAIKKIEEAAFRKACNANTVEAMKAFVSQYPESQDIRDAERLLAELAFKSARAADTLNAYSAFLEKHAASDFADEATGCMARLEFEQALKKNSTKALRNFVAKYPMAPEVDKAHDRLSELEYANLKSSSDILQIEAFLKTYPLSPHYKELRYKHLVKVYEAKLASAEIEAAHGGIHDALEGTLYDAAIEYRSASICQQFLEKYPRSPLAASMKERLETYRADAEDGIEPRDFFRIVLLADVPDIRPYEKKYAEYYYLRAKESFFGSFEDYALYATFVPDSEHMSEICEGLFGKDDLGLHTFRLANLRLQKEYIQRYPKGKHAGKLDKEDVLANELKYLRRIYRSGPVARIIKKIRDMGFNSSDLHPFEELHKEVLAFESLDIDDMVACEAFLKEYPEGEWNNLVREAVYESLERRYEHSDNPCLIPKLIFWMPHQNSMEFYVRIEKVLRAACENKSSAEQLEILRPWLLATGYRYVSLCEKMFLVDLLSRGATLHLQVGNWQASALLSLEAAATAHACHRSVINEQLMKIPKLKIGREIGREHNNIKRWRTSVERAHNNVERARDNIRKLRQFLFAVGIAAARAGANNIAGEFARARALAEQSEDGETVDDMMQKGEAVLQKSDEYKNSGIIRLTNLLEHDRDNWMALRSLSIFPDRKPLETIATMPRFYDYVDDIESYLDKYVEESVALAQRWLGLPDPTGIRHARAFYILGHHRIPARQSDAGPNEFKDGHGFYCYYRIRNGQDKDGAALKELASLASKKDRIALVLWGRARDDSATPPGLKSWLESEVNKKKFNSVSIQIFAPIVDGLSDEDRDDMIDAMYNSYNFDWRQLASVYYQKLLSDDDDVDVADVSKILAGNVPWKKVDLIKVLIEKNDDDYDGFVARYLEGKCYTPGDATIIRRNLENLYTKDAVLGHDERLNTSAVTRAVDAGEEQRKALLIGAAVEGLDILSFEKSVGIVNRRFLCDDQLCIQGASWILKHAEGKVLEPSRFDKAENSSVLQNVVRRFLVARFSTKRDYTKCIQAIGSLSDTEHWAELMVMGVQHGDKKAFQETLSAQKKPEPASGSVLDDPVLDRLSNVILKQRFAQLILMNL